MGRSIGKELERVRLDHAKTLLKETDYKLDAVARLCGYLNTSAFCRAFKTAIGETPSDYRHNA
jgi:LacI family transcriptional regulator